MLILSRKLNERIVIGDDVEVSVVEIKGDHVKLGIAAPRSVKVYRHEVYQAIQAENQAAAQAPSDLGSLAGFFNQAPSEESESGS